MSLNLKFNQSEEDASGLNRLVRSGDEAAETVAQSVRHTSMVRRLRLILPLIAIAMVVIMLAWSDMDRDLEPQRREEVAPQMVGKNELLKPKFQSEDSNQQPYTITADKAFQEASNMDLVILQQPVADVALKNGQWLAIKAKDGEFIQSTQQLHLKGDVRLFHDDGYELQTDKVDLDAAAQTAHTTSPVSGHGPAGTIHGQGLQADGKTGVLIFTGKSKLILNNSHIAPSGKRQP